MSDTARQRIAHLERENAQLVERLIRLRHAVQALAADAIEARREAAALRQRQEEPAHRSEERTDAR
jgi:hypothetical protein